MSPPYRAADRELRDRTELLLSEALAVATELRQQTERLSTAIDQYHIANAKREALNDRQPTAT